MEQAARSTSRTSDADLVESLNALTTRMQRSYATMLELVSELDSRCVACRLGYENTADLLVHVLRITRAEANQRIAQAERWHARAR